MLTNKETKEETLIRLLGLSNETSRSSAQQREFRSYAAGKKT